MRIAIVGGGLQGTEAAYLAHHLGWETVLIDKKPKVPATGLCKHFIQQDVTNLKNFEQKLTQAGPIDIIIPATENNEALAALCQWNTSSPIPLAFDAKAYAITSSKQLSNQLFARLNLPVPLPWPHCHFPIVAKPDNSSGSKGVKIFNDREHLKQDFPTLTESMPKGWILQEYMEGPSFSIEVVGYPRHYHPLLVTDLHMDAIFDCKRVTTPTLLKDSQINQFREIAIILAEVVQLHGVMDVEVILHQDQLKLLEIDARLPSQTPATVYNASGVNILELLVQTFLSPHTLPETGSPLSSLEINTPQPVRPVIYEHIQVTNQETETCGEHIMTDAGPLHLVQDFFGADEAITNYDELKSQWVATVIKKDKAQ